MNLKRKILWVDDEIDLLKGHIIYLNKKGYSISPVSNGEDGIAMVKNETFDAVLLDEMMPGMDGLAVLEEIKNLDPGLPVIMITKSEEEEIMNEAIGSRISDYLIKPVNPSQIFTTLKRLLDSRQLRSERVNREFARQSAQNMVALNMGLDYDGWAQMHTRLATMDLEIEEFNDPALKQAQAGQKKEFRREFGKYVEKNYLSWLKGSGPLLSHKVLDKYILPRLRNNEKVYYVVIDCFRLDHWLAIESTLETMFNVQRDYYYSILPTATPFSRNSLFGGILPGEIARIFPEIWHSTGPDEFSMNKYEAELMELYLKRNGLNLDKKPVYEKILTTEDAQNLYKKLNGYRQHKLISIVYNFIDLLSHHRSESEVLMEIAPDEAAFRGLTSAWFDHSPLQDIFKFIVDEGATLILTTDHGSIIGGKSSVVRGDRTTSTNIRYKYGKNLKSEPSEVFAIDNPIEYGLPNFGPGTNYLFAKEDYYLVYQNNFRQYEKLYQNTFQHGGISMEEMILPIGVLKPL